MTDDDGNARTTPDSGARIRLAPRGIRRIPDLEVREVDESAEIRRRQLSGQKVAEIRVVDGTTASSDEPAELPVRRAPSAAIAIALAAAFAVFGVSLGARARVPAPRVHAAAVEVDPPAPPVEPAHATTAEAPLVTHPAPVAPKPRTRARTH